MVGERILPVLAAIKAKNFSYLVTERDIVS